MENFTLKQIMEQEKNRIKEQTIQTGIMRKKENEERKNPILESVGSFFNGLYSSKSNNNIINNKVQGLPFSVFTYQATASKPQVFTASPTIVSNDNLEQASINKIEIEPTISEFSTIQSPNVSITKQPSLSEFFPDTLESTLPPIEVDTERATAIPPFKNFYTENISYMNKLHSLEGEGDEVTNVKTGFSGITENAELDLKFKKKRIVNDKKIIEYKDITTSDNKSYTSSQLKNLAENNKTEYAKLFFTEYMIEKDKILTEKGVNLEGLKDNEREALFYTLVNTPSLLTKKSNNGKDSKWLQNLIKASNADLNSKERKEFIKIHSINLLDTIYSKDVALRGLANRRAFEYNIAKDSSQQPIERVSIRPKEGKGFNVIYLDSEGEEIFKHTVKKMYGTDSRLSLKNIMKKRNYFDYEKNPETGKFESVLFTKYAENDYEKDNSLQLVEVQQKEKEEKDV